MKTIPILLLLLIPLHADHGHRVKRKVVFVKNSKLYFRLNGKDNVIPSNQLFAHGWGFRINWDLPETFHKKKKFFKRDLNNNINDFITKSGLQNYYSCLLKHVCEMTHKIQASSKCGIFCEIGKIIADSRGDDADFFRSFLGRCDYFMELCPYSFQNWSSPDCD